MTRVERRAKDRRWSKQLHPANRPAPRTPRTTDWLVAAVKQAAAYPGDEGCVVFPRDESQIEYQDKGSGLRDGFDGVYRTKHCSNASSAASAIRMGDYDTPSYSVILSQDPLQVEPTDDGELCSHLYFTVVEQPSNKKENK